MGKRTYKKIKGSCEIEILKRKGKVTMKCKNIKRSPTAEEIVNELNKNPQRIKYR